MTPCTFKVLWRVPCPSCGMTTSWAHMARGQLIQAAQCNVGGVLLWGAACFTGIWMMVSGVRGRWFLGLPNGVFWAAIFLPIALVTMVGWLVKIF
ncbi:MAG: DUF2752 domain-containing protein [Pirellulaceae bacterium]